MERINLSANSSGAVSRSSALFDTSSSSARLSSSSTLPSSADLDSIDQSSLWRKRWRNKTFDESRLGALSGPYAGSDARVMNAKPAHGLEGQTRKEQEQSPRMDNPNRVGSVDRSSFPKLVSDIEVGSSDLGDLFSNVGNRSSTHLESSNCNYMDPLAIKSVSIFVIVLTIYETNTKQKSSPVFSTEPLYDHSSFNASTPIFSRQPQTYDFSPRSWTSDNSDDNLILPSDPTGSPYASNEHNTSSNPASPILLNSRRRPNPGRSAINTKQRKSDGQSPSMVDEDAQLVRRSVIASKAIHSRPVEGREKDKPGQISTSHSDMARSHGHNQQINALSEPFSFSNNNKSRESTFIGTANNDAFPIHKNLESVNPTTRHIIRSEIEPVLDKERHNISYSYGRATKVIDHDSRVEDEETVILTESTNSVNGQRKSREQRRKEADMIVYRQQMEKIGGVRSSVADAQERPRIEPASISSPDLFRNLSSNAVSDGDGDSNDDDDDDYEVPLAVLQAHGFPNKDRAPSKPLGSASSFVLRPPDPTEKQGGKRTSPVPLNDRRQSQLPPFAKHLPEDPHAANLDMPHHTDGDRQSYNRRSMPSVPSRTGQSLPGIPSGGLVAVIADEERARAMRRGTPNAFGGYGQAYPQMGLQTGYMPGDPSMPSNSDALVQQLSQNMLMLQAQMQQMMLSQMNPNQHMPTGMPNTQIAGDASSYPSPYGRPASFIGGTSPVDGASWHAPNTRASVAVSNFSPPSIHAANIPRIETYAPSIAPSERSNVGLSARYRPVSGLYGKSYSSSLLSADQTAAGNGRLSASSARNSIGGAYEERSSNNSTPTNSTYYDAQSKSPPNNKSSTIRAVERVKVLSRRGSDFGTGESDSDSEGWASMKKKRLSKIQLRASAR